jgi:hypothetical protein
MNGGDSGDKSPEVDEFYFCSKRRTTQGVCAHAHKIESQITHSLLDAQVINQRLSRNTQAHYMHTYPLFIVILSIINLLSDLSTMIDCRRILYCISTSASLF